MNEFYPTIEALVGPNTERATWLSEILTSIGQPATQPLSELSKLPEIGKDELATRALGILCELLATMERVYRLTEEGKKQKLNLTLSVWSSFCLFLFFPGAWFIAYVMIAQTFKQSFALSAITVIICYLYGVWRIVGQRETWDKWEIRMTDTTIQLQGTTIETQVSKYDVMRIIEDQYDLRICGKDGSFASGFDIPKGIEHYDEIKRELSKWKPIEVEK